MIGEAGAAWALAAQVPMLGAAALVVRLHLLEPWLHPAHRFLSEYARSRSGRLMQAVFLLAGAATVFLGIAALQRGAQVAAMMLCLAGFGFWVQARYRTDLIDSTDPPTREGRVHDAVSASTFATVVGALFSTAVDRSGLGGGMFGWRVVDLAVSLKAGLLFVLTIVLWFTVHRWFGLTQRLLVTVLMLWSLSVGWRALTW